MSVAVTSRVYRGTHAAIQFTADVLDKTLCAVHALHRKSLYRHYNATANRAAYHRKELTDLSVNTRDQVLQAKIDYQAALKDAEAAFNLKVKSITDTHTTVRNIVVARLDTLNTAAREAQEAIELHDAQV